MKRNFFAVICVFTLICVGCTSTVTSLPSTIVTPTSYPLPTVSLSTVSPVMGFNNSQIIDYSFKLLIDKGLEHEETKYDTADFTAIQFPSGNKGLFVTMGFYGIDRGYQFLYRLQNNQIELLDLVSGGEVWGIKNMETQEQTKIEFLKILNNTKGQVIKITAAYHEGAGLQTNGYFAIVELTDKGIHTLFKDKEEDINENNQGYHNNYLYDYSDLDNDGQAEIIKQGQSCVLLFKEEKGLEKECQDVHEVYSFNGDKYIKSEK